jgi:hypothetical protein
MVAPVREENGLTKVSAPPLSRSKLEPKQRQVTQTALGDWTQRLIWGGFILLSWCLLNALILTETKTHSWQKQQVSIKEMQVRQLQTAIAHRLSNLAKNSLSMSQSHTTPILLGINSSKQEPILLGRR